MPPGADRMIAGRFNARFGRAAGVVLVGGASEPLYVPARGRRPASIRYTRDHAASALHELAHWCVAHPRRRRQVDYGMWYCPPPRSAADQDRFYDAEVPVQALEMLFARICGVPFHFSADNPGADCGPRRRAFEGRVRDRFAALCRQAERGRLNRDAVAVARALEPHWRQRLPAAAPAG